MKDISNLETDITHIFGNITDRLIKVQREAATNIMNDAKRLAPVGETGEYRNSIKISDTKVTENSIETEIYTDEVVETTDGKVYNLGFLIENGTMPHAIPNAFDWGRIYGYDSDMYKRTLDPNWHPGTNPQPHFIPALQKNKFKYKVNVVKAMLKGGK